jgi:hypothetical protein
MIFKLSQNKWSQICKVAGMKVSREDGRQAGDRIIYFRYKQVNLPVLLAMQL